LDLSRSLRRLTLVRWTLDIGHSRLSRLLTIWFAERIVAESVNGIASEITLGGLITVWVAKGIYGIVSKVKLGLLIAVWVAKGAPARSRLANSSNCQR